MNDTASPIEDAQIGIKDTQSDEPLFYRLLDFDPSDEVNLLLYGLSGTGKSAFAGSAGSRSLYIDIGNGRTTLYSPWFRSKFPDCNPIVKIIGEILEKGSFVPDVATAYDAVCDVIDEALTKYPDEFDTVIVDEMSSFGDFSMNKGLELAQKIRKSPGLANSKAARIPMPEVNDFQAEMNLVEKFCAGYIEILKANHKHFIALAHEGHIYGIPSKMGQEAPIHKIMPAFTGKKEPDRIPKLFDTVWQTEVIGKGERVYRVRTAGDEIITCKNRWGGLFNDVEPNLTFPTVIQRVKDHVEKLRKEHMVHNPMLDPQT